MESEGKGLTETSLASIPWKNSQIIIVNFQYLYALYKKEIDNFLISQKTLNKYTVFRVL